MGGPHADTHLRKAATTYHLIENLARHNSLPHLQSQAFVRRQEMHRLQYAKKRQFSKWLRASAARATLLYGESPWRVIGASLLVIFLCGMLYPLGGFREPGSGEVVQVSSVGEWVATLPDGIYFSTLTFTTLGFGDFQPVAWGKWLATMETALGATLIALLVFVLGRRAAR
ncbi:potassium channel family protein [Saliphagus sp. GCM10025308]